MRDHRIRFLLYMLLLLMSAAMTGCNGKEANAQLGISRVIETFVIDPGTFLMNADQAPTVVVGDQSTEYTVNARTTIQFTLATGVAFTRVLFAGEVVLERPIAGIVTIIHGR